MDELGFLVFPLLNREVVFLKRRPIILQFFKALYSPCTPLICANALATKPNMCYVDFSLVFFCIFRLLLKFEHLLGAIKPVDSLGAIKIQYCIKWLTTGVFIVCFKSNCSRSHLVLFFSDEMGIRWERCWMVSQI